MTNKKSINRIVLTLSLAIIAIALTITIIIISGIGRILKANAPASHKTLKVATLQLNKLHSKELKLDRVNLVGKALKSENARQLLVSELKNSKSLLLDELTGDQRLLDLDSLQSLMKLQPSLSHLG